MFFLVRVLSLRNYINQKVYKWVFSLSDGDKMVKHLGKIIAGTVGAGIIVLITLLPKPKAPDRFVTAQNHFSNAQNVVHLVCGGVKKLGNDLDIDYDNMNDHYVQGKDGTVYHTMSRRLVQGEDHTQHLTWFRSGPEELEMARKGGYRALSY